MRARLKEWGRPALELIAPPECAGCGLTGTIWCRDCRERTIRLDRDLCGTCGGPLNGALCRQCADFEPAYSRAGSYAEYRPPFRSLVIRLKYSRDHGLGQIAALLVHKTVLALHPSADLVIPVPLSPERLKRRGYNQVDLFGRPLAGCLGLPYRPEALRRVRETRSQVGLTVDQRMDNLEAAFKADPEPVAGRTILLLDDVFTSGSTGSTCARALFAAGAEAVNVFTLARAVPGRDD